MFENTLLTVAVSSLGGSSVGILLGWQLTQWRMKEVEKTANGNKEEIRKIYAYIQDKHSDMKNEFTKLFADLQKEVHALQLSDKETTGTFRVFNERIGSMQKEVEGMSGLMKQMISLVQKIQPTSSSSV